MRWRLAVVTLIACGACLFGTPQSPTPAEPQRVEAIDFDALRAQAAAALELQQSRERQLASVARTAF